MKVCPLCETGYPNHHTNCATDGALLIESRDFDPGTVIRNYKIVRKLGQGGMGTVYLADHILLGRQRALKFLSKELSHDPKRLKRFRIEALAAIELRHPNIAEVMDLDQAEDGSPYIAMEFVDGPDLRKDLDAALETGPFPVERALNLARGIALGLGAAHARGIVHRDIKPENILIAHAHTSAETPKLLDFGIAAVRNSGSNLSTTRGPGMTLEYAAPEQIKGWASDKLDGRTDLYALGGVFHEMLTGQTMFHSHNTEGWMYHHLQAERVAPSTLRPELAQWPGLDSLVLRMLAVDRDNRPAGVEEFLQELDAIQQNAPPRRRRQAAVTSIETGPMPVFQAGGKRTDTVVLPTGPRASNPHTAAQTGPGVPTFGQQPISDEPKPDRKPAIILAAILLVVAFAGALGYYVYTRGPQTEPVAGNLTSSVPNSGPTGTAQPPVDRPVKHSEPPATPETDILVSCDMACAWKLDGAPQGRLEAASTHRFKVSRGTHRVEAEADNSRLSVRLTPQQKSILASAPGDYDAKFYFEPELTKLVGQATKDAQALAGAMQRGDAKYKGGDNCGAIAAYNEALRINPSYQPALTGRAEATKEQKILGPCDNAN